MRYEIDPDLDPVLHKAVMSSVVKYPNRNVKIKDDSKKELIADAYIDGYMDGHKEGEESPRNVEDEIDNATCGFDYLLGKQLGTEKMWNRDVNPSDPEAVSTYIREVILCAEDELHEVLNEVHWKPWKTPRGIKDLNNYREEMADVLHFILDLYLAAGLTGMDIVADYLSKSEKNKTRHESTSYVES